MPDHLPPSSNALKHENAADCSDTQTKYEDSIPETPPEQRKGHTYIPGAFNVSGFAILGDVYGKDVEGMYLASTRAEIARALSYHGIDSRRHNILTVNANSFEWVWSSSFASWLESDQKLFWITGKPGSGKSTLMKHLAESNLTKQYLARRDGSKWEVLQFFFDFTSGTDLANTAEGMLRSWILQLANYSPKSVTSAPQSLTQAAMLDIIVNALESEGKQYCIFTDGLDEYEGDVALLLSLLLQIEQRTKVKMCLASRDLPPIEINLRDRASGKLVMQKWNAHTIRKYLTAVNDSVAAKLRVPCPVDILEEIARRADGVILWARLALENILQCCSKGDTPAMMRDRLEDLPSEIEGLYERALSKISGELVFEAAIYLRAIECQGVLATRELKAVIHHANRLGQHSKDGFVDLSPLTPSQVEYRIGALCGGLLITDDLYRESLLVQLLYLAGRVFDTLLPTAGSETDIWTSPTRFRLVHETLRAYLRKSEFPSQRSVCIRNSGIANYDDALIREILEAFHKSRQLRARWEAHAEYYGKITLFTFYIACLAWVALLFFGGVLFDE